MKKFFSKILIATLVLGIFLAPFSVNLKNKNNEIGIKAKKSIVKAETETVFYFKYTVVISIDTGQTMEYDSMNYSGPTANDHCEPARKEKVKGVGLFGLQSVSDSCFSKTVTVNPGQSAVNLDAQRVQEAEINASPGFDFGCTFSPAISLVTNCIISLIYYIIYQPIAFFAHLAASVLDFFVYYSINDANYRSTFVELGWSTIRDIANIFFILALLYVAIKTVVGLNSSNNKKLIVTIIGIALVINFSLFATKVVIDASNMLAHIFYANIESVSKNGEKLPEDYGGEKSITVGLAKQFNPQTIFSKDSIKAGDMNEVGTFAIILIMSILLSSYMFYMFLAVALFFVSRVIMLWLLMIFSPIAFASYTIPSVKIPGFGHAEWWEELSKNAFLAPIFIFFLYIIIMFANLSKVVVDNPINENGTVSGQNAMEFMKVIIPFLIIFVLLMKLKSIATKLAGEMGAAIVKGAQVVGGVALGAAAGGVAMVGRKVIGSGAAAVKDGGSNIAQTLAGKFMQGTMLGRGLRNFGTQNWAYLGSKKKRDKEREKEVESKKLELQTTPDTTKSTIKSKETEEHEKLIEGYENRKEEVARNEIRSEFAERLEEMKPPKEEVKLQKDLKGTGSVLSRYASQVGPDGGKIEGVSGAPMSSLGSITISGPVTISGKDVTLNSENLKGGAGGIEEGKKEGKEGEKAKTPEEIKKEEEEKKTTTPKQQIPSARTLKDDVAAGKFGAKQAYQAADFLSKSSFDVRNTKLGQMFSKYTGINMGTMLLGADKGKGGYEGVNAKRKAKELAFEKEISKPSGLETAKLNMLHVDLRNIELQLDRATDAAEKTRLQGLKTVAQSAYDGEKDRLEKIMNMRSENYANTVASGAGLSGGFGLMSKMGLYSPVNLEIAQQILNKIPQKLVKERLDLSKLTDEQKLQKNLLEDISNQLKNSAKE